MMQFRGSIVTSDTGLLAYRELDDALRLTPAAADLLADARTGKNGRHALVGMLRQSVFGRLAGTAVRPGRFASCRARHSACTPAEHLRIGVTYDTALFTATRARGLAEERTVAEILDRGRPVATA
jgi:DDE family transposase